MCDLDLLSYWSEMARIRAVTNLDDLPMPFEIAFTKPVQVADPDVYINECCWGGDVVTERLLPLVTGQYDAIQHEQEDWGWFIWFRKGRGALAIDVFCDDPEQGAFRILLTSRQKRWLLPGRVVDTPELDELKDAVLRELESWTGNACTATRVDENYV